MEHRNIISQTKVTFCELTENEINDYISTEEPYDKAGSYAIQGAGSFMVKSIKGSYTNVMGLPLAETWQEIKRIMSENKILK